MKTNEDSIKRIIEPEYMVTQECRYAILFSSLISIPLNMVTINYISSGKFPLEVSFVLSTSIAFWVAFVLYLSAWLATWSYNCRVRDLTKAINEVVDNEDMAR